MKQLPFVVNPPEAETPHVCVVRLTRTYWRDNRGVYNKCSITVLKRKSVGYDLLSEDALNIGAEDVICNIVNIDSCKDGVYQIVTTDVHRDWETGFVDDYCYKLIPHHHNN